MANFSGLWDLRTQIQATAAENWQGGPSSQIYTWGINTSNSLGGPRTFPDSVKIPQQVKTTQTWASFSFRITRGSAIAKIGELYHWGGGVGTSPVLISSEQTWATSSACSSATSATNDGHTCAIQNDGSLWSIGDNGDGQLGIGTTVTASVLTRVGALTDWSLVVAGAETTHAIKTNGTLWAWGNNQNGRLGDGTVVLRSSPVQIGALTDWAVVSSSAEGPTVGSGAAITNGNVLYTWGSGNGGVLGSGNVLTRSSPVQVGSAVWSFVTVGTRNMVAIRTNGTLWGWGESLGGKLGLGTTSSVSSPVQIGALTTWLSASSGTDTSLFLKNDGTLWSTGRGDDFALGNGNLDSRSSPVQVGTDDYWDSPQSGHTSSAALVKERL
jgi:alpha-tubulin suppressor-like RCC1 family protein